MFDDSKQDEEFYDQDDDWIDDDDDWEDSNTSAKQAKKWLAQLSRDDRGQIESTGINVKIILSNDPNLKGKVAIDEFSRRMIIRGKLPWARSGSDWLDSDDGSLQIYLEQYYGVVGPNKIMNALNEIALENSFHPVKEYLDSLEWDGKKRIEQIFRSSLAQRILSTQEQFQKFILWQVLPVFITRGSSMILPLCLSVVKG